MSALVEQGAKGMRERVAIFRLLGEADSAEQAREICAALVAMPSDVVGRIDVHHLLEACKGVGPEQADAWQSACGLFEAISLGELDAERRAALVALLRFRSPFTRRVVA